MKLFQEIGKAENAIDQALYLIANHGKLTRREAQAIEATIDKIQFTAEKIKARAFQLKPKVTVVRRRGKLVIKNY